MGFKANRSLEEALANLEAQAAFHREREAFHAEHEARHREQRSAHAAELAEILRRREAFRSAAAEVVDLADRPGPAPSVQSLPEDDVVSSSRPQILGMLKRVIADKGTGERFGPEELTGEVNRRFGQRLRKPVRAGHISTALRRLERKGIIHLVQKGRPHSEALYVRVAPSGGTGAPPETAEPTQDFPGPKDPTMRSTSSVRPRPAETPHR